MPGSLDERRVDGKRDEVPPGWDEERGRKVLAHYEEQTEEEATTEDEAALVESSQEVDW